MKFRNLLTLALLSSSFLLTPLKCFGQIVIIVNKSNPTKDISIEDIRDIYSGKKQAWSSGAKIQPVFIEFKNETARKFLKVALETTAKKQKRIWIKLALSGKAQPPIVLRTEKDVLAYVAQDEKAVGFVPTQDLNSEVKAIMIDGRDLADKNYFLRDRN